MAKDTITCATISSTRGISSTRHPAHSRPSSEISSEEISAAPVIKGRTFFFLSYEGLRQRQGLTTTSNVFSDFQRSQIQSSGSASAQGLLQFVPAANGTLNGAPSFFGSASANVNIDQGTVDISHNFSDKDRIHGYYANQHDLRLEPTQGADIPGFGDTRAGVRQVITWVRLTFSAPC